MIYIFDVLYLSTACLPLLFLQQRLTPGIQFNWPPLPRVIITGRPKAVLLLRLRFHLFYMLGADFHFLNVLSLTVLCVQIINYSVQ